MNQLLILKPRKIGLRLDEDLKKHLFSNLNNGRRNKKQSNDIPRIQELMAGVVDHFKKELRTQNTPTQFDLDEVLDKINAHGINSLTSAEKHFLKNIPK